MKKKEFIHLIEVVVDNRLKTIIKEEVKTIIEEIFIEKGKTSLFDSAYTPAPESPSIEESASLVDIMNEHIPDTTSEFVHKNNYKNSTDVIDHILNETKGGIPQGDDGGYRTMGTYDTSNIHELFMKEQPIMNRVGGAPVHIDHDSAIAEQKRQIGAVQSIKESGLTVDQIPDGVKKALTRNYSELVKTFK